MYKNEVSGFSANLLPLATLLLEPSEHPLGGAYYGQQERLTAGAAPRLTRACGGTNL